MPNPAFEGVAADPRVARESRGDAARTVYDDKVRTGTADFTHIHHRETALFLMGSRTRAAIRSGVPGTGRASADAHQHSAEQNTTAIAGAMVKTRRIRRPRARVHPVAGAFRIFQRYLLGRYDAATPTQHLAPEAAAIRRGLTCAARWQRRERPTTRRDT